jgi:hypothetical protein
MKKIVLQLSLFSIVAGTLLPGTILIGWKKNTENDLAGYKVYWGTQPGRYSDVKNVGLDTSWTVSHLQSGNYFFSVTAYDTIGNESKNSAELKIFIETGEEFISNTAKTSYYNFPNPFNPGIEKTSFRYFLNTDKIVTIDIYDVNENLVRNLLPPTLKSAGEHTEDIWDGTSNFGLFMPNGVYYAIIKFEFKKKVITIGIVR